MCLVGRGCREVADWLEQRQHHTHRTIGDETETLLLWTVCSQSGAQ